MNDVWDNPVARPHHRQLFHYRQPSLATGPVRIPDGFQRVAIDTALLTRTALQHCQAIADQVNDEWGADQFSQHGFGVCLIHDQTIASHCLADYGVGTRCEVGVGTDPGYRRQGLAGLVVAAAVQAGLARGFDHIGWHCLRSNAGSRAIAEHAGFVKVAEYYGYGSGLPAENATDLTSAEWAAWAEHYEQARTRFPHYTYHAAGAWALAGDTDRACDHIHHLVEHEPNARAAWFAGWWFESLHATAAFKALQATLRQRE